MIIFHVLYSKGSCSSVLIPIPVDQLPYFRYKINSNKISPDLKRSSLLSDACSPNNVCLLGSTFGCSALINLDLSRTFLRESAPSLALFLRSGFRDLHCMKWHCVISHLFLNLMFLNFFHRLIFCCNYGYFSRGYWCNSERMTKV